MIKIINLGVPEFNDYSFENDLKIISGLSRVNIFIGPNNSGKSRFLRHLFGIIEFQVIQTGDNIHELDNLTNEFENWFSQNYAEKDYKPIEPLRSIFNGLKINRFSDYFSEAKVEKIKTTLETIISYSSNPMQIFLRQDNLFKLLHPEVLKRALEIIKWIDKEYVRTKIEDYTKNYIPILRGLRPFSSNNDFYAERTASDYFKENKKGEGNIRVNIHTGLNYYTNIKSKLLSTKDKRNNIRHFEEFIRKKFFPDKKEFTLIPKENSDVLLIGFGDDEEERHIYDLGDGIQAIIQLLYPIFSCVGEKTLFFIEEPEINLHPGMQRVFLETLLSEEFKDMQFFITTHSNHFLDLTFDDENISVYGFSKITIENKFKIKNLVKEDKNILKDLGIRNSSVFLSNCTIWVEGITDRKYIRKYLELYWEKHKKDDKKPYFEDLHYSFVEYAGSNIVHWNFDQNNEDENINALKVSNNIFLVLDSDVNKEGIVSKEERHQKLKVALGDNLYITEGKEIENSLSLNIIKKVVAEYEKVDLNDLKFKKTLIETEKIKSHNSNSIIEKPYYWKDNIGKLIDNSLKERTRKSTYAKDNSVNDKDAFCDKAIKHLEKYEDLSDEAKGIAERIVSFIESCNK
ncbi:MAG: ATP-binding protein [Bacteroidota bacterium]|nr:ATP-binding protein [Bacteroidota bacterium]